jgi:Zn finger protein HypA/HybF involved in hydrogenase expression
MNYLDVKKEKTCTNCNEEFLATEKQTLCNKCREKVKVKNRLNTN